jgi:hypothetical protein
MLISHIDVHLVLHVNVPNVEGNFIHAVQVVMKPI